MDKKPYPQNEEQPMVAGEPAVTYQHTAPATYPQGVSPCGASYDNDDEAFEALMNADLSELGEGFRPFTWEEARQWIAKAEEDIAAGNVVSHEEVMREIDELIWSYEN